MTQLGYTWYPKDWFTSSTRKRLKRFPLVKYAIRELFDLMYMELAPIEMNREYLIDDLDIELSDDEYEKLMEHIEVQPDGKWWINSVKKRISKAESARENGKKGGRPKKTQEPRKKTQEQNPKNPPSESKSKRESKSKSKRESKSKSKRESKEGFLALDILRNEKLEELNIIWMQNKKQIPDIKKLQNSFNDKMELEVAQGKIEFDSNQLMPRFKSFVRNWISNSQDANAKKQNTPEPDSWESGKLPNRN